MGIVDGRICEQDYLDKRAGMDCSEVQYSRGHIAVGRVFATGRLRRLIGPRPRPRLVPRLEAYLLRPA